MTRGDGRNLSALLASLQLVDACTGAQGFGKNDEKIFSNIIFNFHKY